MNWYFLALSKFLDFKGRARRKEYWYFILFSFLIFLLLAILDMAMENFNEEIGIGLLSGIYLLAVILPSWSVGIRRLHDTNRSGWWMLINIIPLGVIIFLYFMLLDSETGNNQYGSNPTFISH